MTDIFEWSASVIPPDLMAKALTAVDEFRVANPHILAALIALFLADLLPVKLRLRARGWLLGVFAASYAAFCFAWVFA